MGSNLSSATCKLSFFCFTFVTCKWGKPSHSALLQGLNEILHAHRCFAMVRRAELDKQKRWGIVL